MPVFVPESTRKRFKILGTQLDELYDDVDPTILPTTIGGLWDETKIDEWAGGKQSSSKEQVPFTIRVPADAGETIRVK